MSNGSIEIIELQTLLSTVREVLEGILGPEPMVVVVPETAKANDGASSATLIALQNVVCVKALSDAKCMEFRKFSEQVKASREILKEVGVRAASIARELYADIGVKIGYMLKEVFKAADEAEAIDRTEDEISEIMEMIKKYELMLCVIRQVGEIVAIVDEFYTVTKMVDAIMYGGEKNE